MVAVSDLPYFLGYARQRGMAFGSSGQTCFDWKEINSNLLLPMLEKIFCVNSLLLEKEESV